MISKKVRQNGKAPDRVSIFFPIRPGESMYIFSILSASKLVRRQKNGVCASAVEIVGPLCAVPARREHGGCICSLFLYNTYVY